MGRNASIQMFLLTLTGCSWMLLFLSIALPDYHVFREYHPAHVAAAAAHTSPPREVDPCELCWGVGKPCQEEEEEEEEEEEGEAEDSVLEGDVPKTGDTGWGTRLAQAVGASEEEEKEKLSATLAPEVGRVGGVGAFYYYTLHTTFTALRVRLKKAQQVAGDVQEEVASLGESVAQLQHTLITRFSPRFNPYLRKTRLTRPEHPNQDAEGPEKERGRSHPHREASTVDARRENLRRVYPVMMAETSKGASSEYLALGASLPRRRSGNSSRGDHRDLDHERSTGRKMQEVKNQETTSQSLRKSVNVTGSPWKHGSVPGKGNKTDSSKQETERRRNAERSRGGTWDLRKGETGGDKARSTRDWSSNFAKSNVQRTVSVVLLAGVHEVDGLLVSLGRTYPGITVHLMTVTPPSKLPKQKLRLVIHEAGANASDGMSNTEVLNRVTTPYVLVATGMTSLTRLARLERLVWAAEQLGVWAISGGLQTPSGQWHTGCLTSTYAHYEASWSHGRLGSAGECSLCHSLMGPFLALTSALRHIGWDGELPRRVNQLDLFLRASHTHHMLAASCPKSLFKIASDFEAPPRASLLSLARRHRLYSVQPAGGTRFTFSCSEVGASCGGIGLALPPCCRQELADLVRFTMATCEARGLLCELQEGTLLGAVKVGGVMPWERDADITFHTKNFTALEEMKDVFDRAGYSLRLTDNRWCCADGQWAGGQGSLSSGQWRAELWSQHAMDSEDNILAGRPLTKIEFDGSWVAAPTSPGHYVRNRYGIEVFRHAQHWMDTGRSSGWEEYEPGQFLPCPRPAHHACLDQYVPDGNLKLYPLCLEQNQ